MMKNDKELTIYNINTRVKFGEKKTYKGFISQITITISYGIIYEISYWNNDEMKKITLTEDYFDVYKEDADNKNKIGFITE